MRRSFIVGCPRSGTTIVQALLARHPAIYTLPETAFFEQLHGDLEWRWGDALVKPPRRKLKHRLGFIRRPARETFQMLQQRLAPGERTPTTLFTDTLSRHFVALLDRSAAMAGRRMW